MSTHSRLLSCSVAAMRPYLGFGNMFACDNSCRWHAPHVRGLDMEAAIVDLLWGFQRLRGAQWTWRCAQLPPYQGACRGKASLAQGCGMPIHLQLRPDVHSMYACRVTTAYRAVASVPTHQWRGAKSLDEHRLMHMGETTPRRTFFPSNERTVLEEAQRQRPRKPRTGRQVGPQRT